MYLKIHKSYRTIVSICDEEILGKKFEEGKFQLDLRESFYKGESMDENKIISMIKKMALEDATFNIAGEQSIKTAINAGIITAESIARIKNIPFALVLI